MRLASTVSNLSAGTAGLNAHIVAKNKPPANRTEVVSAAPLHVTLRRRRQGRPPTGTVGRKRPPLCGGIPPATPP